MNVAPLHDDPRRSRVEVLVLELALEASVHRVGETGPEALHVEKVHSPADLLVGSESDADLAVRNLGMGEQPGRRRHDLGHAGLVVGPEQRRTVGHDQRMPLEKRELGKILHPHRKRVVQRNIAAVVALDQAGTNVHPFHVGTRIDMRDEADHGFRFAPRRGRNGPGHVAVRIDLDLGHPERDHLLDQTVQQRELLSRRRKSLALGIALRIESDVAEKALLEFFDKIHISFHLVVPFRITRSLRIPGNVIVRAVPPFPIGSRLHKNSPQRSPLRIAARSVPDRFHSRRSEAGPRKGPRNGSGPILLWPAGCP